MWKSSWLVVILSGFAGFGALTHHHISKETRALVSHSKDFIQMLSRGDTRKAYAQTTRAFRKHYSHEEFASKARYFRNTASYKQRESHVMFSRGTVRGHLHTPQGRVYHVTLMFKKVKGDRRLAALQWKETVTGVVKQFLEHVRAQKPALAYRFAGEDLRKRRTLQDFTRWLALHQLHRFHYPRWYAVDQSKLRGVLQGVLLLRGGEALKCAVELRKEKGYWMIQKIHLSP